MKLYPHNQSAYNNIQKVWETTNRTCIIRATGTGKSYIIAEIINSNPKAKCLILAPSIFILSGIKNCLIQPDNCVFYTYQYISLNGNLSIIDNDFDFIILDEFHRIGASFWQDNVNSVLESNVFAKVLGTSATHIRFLDKRRNMAEELFFNSISSNLDLGNSILQKIHKKPIYIASIYNIDKHISELEIGLKKRGDKESLNRLNSNKIDWINSIGVDKVISKHLSTERKKIVVFCKDIKHMNYIQKLIQNPLNNILGSVNFLQIHSKLPLVKLQSIFDTFSNSNSPQVILTVDMLNEGVHINGADTIMMFRDTVSPILYFQQIGRAFHVNQGNQPLIFDFVNNFKIKNSEYEIIKTMFETPPYETQAKLSRLSKEIIQFTDETIDFQTWLDSFPKSVKTWDELFDEVKELYLKLGRAPMHREHKWLSQQKLLFNQKTLDTEKTQKLLSLDPEIFKSIVSSWDESYQIVKLFIKKNKRLPLAKESSWIQVQKNRFKKGSLSKNEIEKLLMLDPSILNLRAISTWEDSYLKLKKFINKNNRIPTTKEFYWMAQQRNFFKNGKLSEEQILLLNQLHPELLTSKLKTEEVLIKELEVLVSSLGKAPSTSQFYWLSQKKHEFNKGKLSKELIRKINLILPNYLQEKTKTWEESFDEIKEFYNKNKRFPTFKETKSQWLRVQKTTYREGKMPQSRINEIKNLDPTFFEYKKEIITWEDQLKTFKIFVREHNRLPKQREFSWFSNQRLLFKSGKLSKERYHLILEIDSEAFDGIF